MCWNKIINIKILYLNILLKGGLISFKILYNNINIIIIIFVLLILFLFVGLPGMREGAT